MVDFDKILDYLDNVFLEDEKAKDILDKAGITESQIKIMNTLIINAIRAYDIESRKE